MFDLLAVEFKDKLVKEVNESGLPMTAVAYILQEIIRQVTAIAEQQAEKQKQQRDAALAAEQEK